MGEYGDIAGDDAGAAGDPGEASFVVGPMDEAPAEETSEDEAPAKDETPAE